ncbi:hypothetical protein BTO05_13440 [Winogradskyella sp. PC-19]|uniref:DUF6090 family protein n=1 Tax=unclassified Winogradskyella TaxID=2615021 RepID=UPI000B55F3E0|nr:MULTISPECIES: DUF6090 family protein [unclassified Winogradskyella]ARV10589.1 hypothetical protein BTO05_13440 [Winogradskyella sp. PC-19]
MENKNGKYFKYAIGEIVLVVIGILIALQINSWYGKQVNNAKQEKYLESIVNDLNQQLINLDYHLNEENENLFDIQKLVSIYNKNKRFDLNDTTLNYFGSVFDRTTFLANRTTYTQLLSTGDIGIINNGEIRDEIVKYYQHIERRELVVQKNNDVKDLVINPIFLKNIDLTYPSITKSFKMNETYPRQLEQTNINLLQKDILFETVNIIKVKLLSTQAIIQWFKEDKERTLDLIDLINNELK